jgi:hypothetical protein
MTTALKVANEGSHGTGNGRVTMSFCLNDLAIDIIPAATTRSHITALGTIVGSRAVVSGDVISTALAGLRDPKVEFGCKWSVARGAFDPAQRKGTRHQEPGDGQYDQQDGVRGPDVDQK